MPYYKYKSRPYCLAQCGEMGCEWDLTTSDPQKAKQVCLDHCKKTGHNTFVDITTTFSFEFSEEELPAGEVDF